MRLEIGVSLGFVLNRLAELDCSWAGSGFVLNRLAELGCSRAGLFGRAIHAFGWLVVRDQRVLSGALVKWLESTKQVQAGLQAKRRFTSRGPSCKCSFQGAPSDCDLLQPPRATVTGERPAMGRHRGLAVDMRMGSAGIWRLC